MQNDKHSFVLKIDNATQTIQGIHISDKLLFTQLRFVVENNCLEGWKPSKEDIKYLIYKAYNPDSKLDDAIDKLLGNKVSKRRY